MRSKYKLCVKYVPETGYFFSFDESTSDMLTFNVSENDELCIIYGRCSYSDYETNKKRKKHF